ncbi:unnamed protein product, partial [Prorocentrum cordatum]
MRGVGQALARSTAWPAMLAMLCGLPFVLFGPLRASKVLGSGRVMQPRPGSASGPTARGAGKGTVPDPQDGRLFFFHITHHAGTNIKSILKLSGLCEINADPFLVAPDNSTLRWFNVWKEESEIPPEDLSSFMPCDSDGFVSVVSLRDPIERTFAGDGMWKTFANGTNMDMCSSDNYGLRKLIDKPLPANLSWEDVEFAKRRLASFDLIIDQGNYATSMKLLCAELGLSYCGVAQKVHRYP